MLEPRMDGSPLQQALFRIAALREALSEAPTFGGEPALKAHVRNALAVDDARAHLEGADR